MEDYPIKTSSPEQIQRELDVFVKEGRQSLAISGGEPTLLKGRLLSLITDARKGGIRFVELQTNAILLDSAYVADLKEAGLTSAFVSFLSHVPVHHDSLAGLEGAFQLCIDGIRALLAAGISVTLNPVIAKETQGLVVEYVEFVAANLKGVGAISFSAVQPHGRAAKNLDLLPDYAVLKSVMPLAIEAALKHGIKALNPFCGLPLCVGWKDSPNECVEWQESLSREDENIGKALENEGNKSHGTPCFDCVFRSRCGGAWHAYWSIRQGSGIEPPQRLQNPLDDRRPFPYQSTIFAMSGLDETVFSSLKKIDSPTIWLVIHHFYLDDIDAIARSAATEIALLFDPEQLLGPGAPALLLLKRIKRLKEGLSPRQQLHLVVPPSSPIVIEGVRELTRRLSLRPVTIMSPQ